MFNTLVANQSLLYVTGAYPGIFLWRVGPTFLFYLIMGNSNTVYIIIILFTIKSLIEYVDISMGGGGVWTRNPLSLGYALDTVTERLVSGRYTGEES
jgi:hypothetical protein